jgi:hypothetical protein
MAMRYLEKLGHAAGIAAVLLLMSGGAATNAAAATSTSPAIDSLASLARPFDGAEPADARLGSTIPSLATLQPTLQQRRGRGGGRAVRPPARTGGRVAVPRARGGGRTVIVRGGRYYAPYYYGFGYPYGYWGYPYGGYWGGYYGYYGGSYSYTGSVRLKVKPEDAEVLVDGYYVGTVDDFDGAFQSLKLEPGPANIEVRAPGFEPLRVDVRILPGRKITYEANMRAGDPGPAPQPQPPAVRPQPPNRAPGPGVATGPPAPGDPGADPGDQGDYDQPMVAYGGVRLRVEPRDAQVFVDGYFVGVVDDFDSGKGLPLESGPQNIEIRADGYQPLQIQVRILPDETITYEGSLTPVAGQL